MAIIVAIEPITLEYYITIRTFAISLSFSFGIIPTSSKARESEINFKPNQTLSLHASHIGLELCKSLLHACLGVKISIKLYLLLGEEPSS